MTDLTLEDEEAHAWEYWHDRAHKAEAEVERLRKVLREISRQYENQNLNHVDFRVAARQATDAALTSAKQEAGAK